MAAHVHEGHGSLGEPKRLIVYQPGEHDDAFARLSRGCGAWVGRKPCDRPVTGSFTQRDRSFQFECYRNIVQGERAWAMFCAEHELDHLKDIDPDLWRSQKREQERFLHMVNSPDSPYFAFEVTPANAAEYWENVMERIFVASTPEQVIHKAMWKYWAHPDMGEKRLAAALHAVSLTFPKADVVFWDLDIWDLAYKGADAFTVAPYRPEDVAPDRPQVWTWATTRLLSDSTLESLDLPNDAAMTAIGIFPIVGAPILDNTTVDSYIHATIDTGVAHIPASRHAGQRGVIHVAFFCAVEEATPYLRVLPLAWEGEAMPIPWFHAPQAFLRLPIVEKDPVRRSRAEWRRLERDRKGRPLPETRRVLLRKVAQPNQGAEAGDSGRDWSCQWLVRGHWRRQYLPSKKEHRPTFILPHVKGPAGKPFREPRRTTFVAVR